MPYKQPEYQFHPSLQARDILRDHRSTIAYQQGMSFFYGELAHLGSTAHTVERIIDFPWDVFAIPLGAPYFFRLVVGNFLEYGAIMAVRLYRDKRKDAHDLSGFKDRIMNKLIKEEHRETLRHALGEVDFDQRAVEGFEKAKKLRDNMLVHSNKTWFGFDKVPVGPPEQGEETSEEISFGVSELQHLRDALDSVYVALWLGNDPDALPLEYKPPIYTRPSREWILRPRGSNNLDANITDILNNYARNSWAWNLPEISPASLAQLSNDQITKLDAYRQQLNKPRITLTQEQYDAINNSFFGERKPKLSPDYLE